MFRPRFSRASHAPAPDDATVGVKDGRRAGDGGIRPRGESYSPTLDDRRAAWAIGLFACVIVACEVAALYVPSTWIQRDGRFYVNISTTLLERGSLEQPFARSWYSGTLGWNRELDVGWSNIALGARGEFYPKHTWILPLLALPLFAALGLLGTLVWSALVYGAAGMGAYRFARAFASPAPSALAALALLWLTGARETMYDHQVDPLILAMGLFAMACAVETRGFAAGLLLGTVVLMRPTALMLLPPVGAVLLASPRLRGRAPLAWRALARALAGGAAMLALGAVVNTAMFGRPWLTGYNRILAVVHGVPQIVDNAGSFAHPLGAGLRRTWSGGYGLRQRAAVFALALPGLLVLCARRPVYAFSAIGLSAASALVFAKYVFEGDRFHWLALGFLVPALAVTLDVASGFGARCMGFTQAITSALQRLVTRGHDARFAQFGQAIGRAFIGPRHGMIRSAPATVFAVALGWMVLTRMGAHGDFTLDGAVWTRCVGAALLAALVCAALTKVAEPTIAAVTALVPLALPGMREVFVTRPGDAQLADGAGLAAALCAALAIALVAHAPPRALRHARRRAALMFAGAAICAAVAVALVVFADVPQPAAPAWNVRAAQLAQSLMTPPSPMRALAPLLVLALPGLAVALQRDGRSGVAMLALAWLVTGFALTQPAQALAASRTAAPGLASAPLVALALTLPLSVMVSFVARGLASLRASHVRALLALILVGLCVAGALRRHHESQAPLRFATPRGVRLAEVRAGEVPCDFLAWEHLSWECSHLDSGTYALSGLATSEPPRVAGAPIPLFLLAPTSLRQPRSATWRGVRGSATLRLDWAVPDGERGGVSVEIAIDGARVDSFEVPATPSGGVAHRTIATPAAAGRTVDVTITVRGAGLVGIDGGFAGE
jgi:hypothetical protein